MRGLFGKFIRYWHNKGIVYATAMVFQYICNITKWRFIIPIKMRYYRIICGGIGVNAIFDSNVKVFDASHLFVGDNVGLNTGCWVDASGGIFIGHNTRIGPMTVIHSANHRFNRLDIPIYQQGWTEKPVVIEDDVWIAASCIILPGVRIGRGSVIAAGAVVTHDIPQYSVAAGVPAVVIKSRLDATAL